MKTTKTKKHISQRLRQFARANEAVSALEYALLVGVIAVGVGAGIVTFQNEITQALTDIGTQVDTATGLTGATAPTP